MKRNPFVKVALTLLAVFVALNLYVSRGGSTAARAADPKVEYKVLTVPTFATPSQVEATLNDQALLGWELVQIVQLPSPGFPSTNATMLVFTKKR